MEGEAHRSSFRRRSRSSERRAWGGIEGGGSPRAVTAFAVSGPRTPHLTFGGTSTELREARNTSRAAVEPTATAANRFARTSERIEGFTSEGDRGRFS